MTAQTLSLGEARAEISAPAPGVLRLLFRREGGARGNYPLAVSGATPSPIAFDDDTCRGDGIAARLDADGLKLLCPAPDGALEPVCTIRHVHLSEQAHLVAALTVGADDPFFGLGEQTGPMNRRHRRVVNWNLDYAPHTPSTPSFYASFPVYVSRARSSRDLSIWYGVFLDNPGRSVFDLALETPEAISLAVHTGDLDLYVFAGPTPADVVRRYCALTGTMEMPPRWMLGYQQSRWSYSPDDRVREVAQGFRHHQFPCDVIYLDIDYMDRFRSFTWDPEKFPHPRKLIDGLHAQGFKVIPILNSAVAVDPTFHVYREGHEKGYFLKHPDGAEYQDQMWPGLCAFPDFTRAEVRDWWGGLHAGLLGLDVDGLWNDMNEPTVFGENPPRTFPMDLVHEGEGAPRPHEELHNAYSMLMDQATREGLARLKPGRRLPLLTRSAYAGVQRYAFMWTGDNSGWWDHLRLCISQVCNLGLSGVPISGPDVGGFHDNCSGEMFLRWLELAVFLPYLRAHSMQGTRDAEPWAFGPQVLERGRSFVGLRYELIPYLYTLAAAAARRGDPIVRPLFYEFPQDLSSEVVDDQFMLGPDLMVAPIMAPGRFYRAVYLPQGEWHSLFGDSLHEGAGLMLAESPLDHIPVYVRAGAIIPMGPRMQHVGERPATEVSWHVWAASSGEGHGWLYEDDGETDGAARAARGFGETHVRAVFTSQHMTLRFEPRVGDFDPGPREVEVVVRGARRAPRTCSLEGMRAHEHGFRVAFHDDGAGREIRFDW